MKLQSLRSFSPLLHLAVFGVSLSSAPAAMLMTMGFNNSGADINENDLVTPGWNGTTTARGGSLATGLAVTTGMQIFGDFTAQNQPDSFHVDGWRTTNSSATGVGMTIGALSGYMFSLGGGTETFSTRLHQHPTGSPSSSDMFNSVTLLINGISIGSQSYTPAGGAQTLTWNIGTNASLDNLTSATFDLKFTGTNDPGNNNHGPEWALNDSAFVSLTGSVIPEPSQAVLACLGVGLVLIRRRR
jgi:hypothetical protein